MINPTFGELLRAARQRAGFESYRKFAAALHDLGLTYADETLGNWERDERKPARDLLLRILSVLAASNGFLGVTEIKLLLDAGDYERLTPDEAQTYFSNLPDDVDVPNLPPKSYHQLIGRTDLVKQIIDILLDPTALPLIVISGLGGIGKTALAHAVVRHVMLGDEYDMLLWQSVKSESFISTSISRREAVSSFNEAMLAYARQLGLDERDIQVDKVKAALTRRLKTERVLVVLDNLETLPALEHVTRELHEMVSAGKGSRVLLTSRKRLVDEPYLVDYQVRGLSDTATKALLRDEAQQRGAISLLQADAVLMDRIYEVTGGMPLAIKLIVSQYLLGIGLDQALNRLTTAVDEAELYRFIYFDIWNKLSLDAQKLLVGSAAVSNAMLRSTLISASQLTDATFTAALPELVKTSLLEVRHHPIAERQRYEIHPITRWFVNSVLQALWKGDDPSPV